MPDVPVCAACDAISDETHRRLVEGGRLPPGAERRPAAVCFLRNALEDADGGVRDGSRLEPVCPFHRGECVLTVVLLEDGMGEYVAQTVMGS